MKIAIIIPAFNEEKTIENVVKNCLYFGDVYVVNDASTDKTYENAKSTGAIIINHAVNRGYDYALSSGLQAALNSGATHLITFDGDGQFHHEEINKIIKGFDDGYKVICGSRLHKQRFSEKLFSLVTKRLWCINDPLCGIKGYDAECLRDLGKLNTYKSFGTEILFRSLKSGFKILDVPIRVMPRFDGKSRMGKDSYVNTLMIYSLLRGLLLLNFPQFKIVKTWKSKKNLIDDVIPYSTQSINQEDIDSVVEVLNSEYITQGEKGYIFESSIAAYVGAKYVVATNSATSALHLACRALNVGPGDIVWTSAISFVASANCALYCGASIDFIDIDPETYNISVNDLERKLIESKNKNCLPSVLVVVHLCGQPSDLASIYKLSQEYRFKIIEDASHALGASYNGFKIGACKYSDITVFSFHPVKTITTGEGGSLVTNNEMYAKKALLLRSHGITRNYEEMGRVVDGPWQYDQIMLGYNYRMTDFQAALGISQLKRIQKFVDIRYRLAVYYSDQLRELPITLPIVQHEHNYFSHHLYVIRLKTELINKSHLEVFEFLRESKINVNLHYMPIYMHSYYRSLGEFQPCVEAEKYYKEAISLPLFPGMSTEQQDYVCMALKSALRA